MHPHLLGLNAAKDSSWLILIKKNQGNSFLKDRDKLTKLEVKVGD